MSSIPDTLRRIAEQIATLEAERDRLIREVVAMNSKREEIIAAGIQTLYRGDNPIPEYCPGPHNDPRCKGSCIVADLDRKIIEPGCFQESL